MAVYNTKAACEKASITRRQIHYWIEHGLLPDKSNTGSGSKHLFSEAEVVYLRFLGQMALIGLAPVENKQLVQDIWMKFYMDKSIECVYVSYDRVIRSWPSTGWVIRRKDYIR